MSQDGPGVDLETSMGYMLKGASSALRVAMEEATAAVRSVETTMLTGLTPAQQRETFSVLQSMIRSLRDGHEAD